ncbi:MAG: hypothetical protein Q9182_004088 [Xanthomendoza sp. 2 TL-2023]
MTSTTARPLPQSTPSFQTPTKEPANPSPFTSPSTSLESQRVTALLNLNRVLIQEVVLLQESQKENKSAGTSISNHQQTPQQASPSPAIGSSTTATPPTKSDTAKPESEATTNTTNPPATDDASSSSKPTQSQQPQPTKPPSSKEYIDYMRRLQANLAYLASVADRHHKPGNAVAPYPNYMEAPDLGPSAVGGKDGVEAGDVDGKGRKESLKELYAKLRELWPEYKGKANAPGTIAGTTAAATTTTTTTTPATSAPAPSTSVAAS